MNARKTTEGAVKDAKIIRAVSDARASTASCYNQTEKHAKISTNAQDIHFCASIAV